MVKQSQSICDAREASAPGWITIMKDGAVIGLRYPARTASQKAGARASEGERSGGRITHLSDGPCFVLASS